MAVLSESKRRAGLGKDLSNSTSESQHGTVTQLMKTAGTIRLDHAAVTDCGSSMVTLIETLNSTSKRTAMTSQTIM